MVSLRGKLKESVGHWGLRASLKGVRASQIGVWASWRCLWAGLSGQRAIWRDLKAR